MTRQRTLARTPSGQSQGESKQLRLGRSDSNCNAVQFGRRRGNSAAQRGNRGLRQILGPPKCKPNHFDDRLRKRSVVFHMAGPSCGSVDFRNLVSPMLFPDLLRLLDMLQTSPCDSKESGKNTERWVD